MKRAKQSKHKLYFKWRSAHRWHWNDCLWLPVAKRRRMQKLKLRTVYPDKPQLHAMVDVVTAYTCQVLTEADAAFKSIASIFAPSPVFPPDQLK